MFPRPTAMAYAESKTSTDVHHLRNCSALGVRFLANTRSSACLAAYSFLNNDFQDLSRLHTRLPRHSDVIL